MSFPFRTFDGSLASTLEVKIQPFFGAFKRAPFSNGCAPNFHVFFWGRGVGVGSLTYLFGMICPKIQ